MTLKSVHTLLDVLHFADSHTAIVVPELGIRVTYDSLRKQVFDMANALASLGIRRGDAVAIVLPNGLPAIVSFLAASIAGTAAPLNPAYPYEEFLFFSWIPMPASCCAPRWERNLRAAQPRTARFQRSRCK